MIKLVPYSPILPRFYSIKCFFFTQKYETFVVIVYKCKQIYNSEQIKEHNLGGSANDE